MWHCLLWNLPGAWRGRMSAGRMAIMASGFGDRRSPNWKATPARTTSNAAFCIQILARPGAWRGRMSAGRTAIMASGFGDTRSPNWKATPARTTSNAAFCTGSLPGAWRGRMSAGTIGYHGIELQDQARPTQLEGNTCENNQQACGMYWESASGVARQNVCRQNGNHGIGVQGQIPPGGTAAIGKQHLREQPAKRNSLLRLCRRACAAKHLFGQSAVWHLCSFHGKACAVRQ
jgi:parallel beta-helix repeat protein